MTKKEEMLDIYDVNGTWIGIAPRSQVHEQGLWHRSFHCWILFVDELSQNCIILQRRGFTAKDWPGYLDISAAGHYKANEGIEGGLRELYEELGLKVDRAEMRKIGLRTIDEHLDNGTINREFQDVYFLNNRYALSDYRPDFSELEGVYQFYIDELKELLSADKVLIRGKEIKFDNATNKIIQNEITTDLNEFIPNALHYLQLIIQTAYQFLNNKYTEDNNYTRMRLPDGSFWQANF